MKRSKKPSFNVNEDEAELFLSLKNAFSSLAIDEGADGDKKDTDNNNNNHTKHSVHEERDGNKFSGVGVTTTTTDMTTTTTTTTDMVTSHTSNTHNTTTNTSITTTKQLELSDHQKFVDEINPDELALRVKGAFQKWEETLKPLKPPPQQQGVVELPNLVISPLPSSLEQSFAEIETEIMCVTEAAEYIMNVAGSNVKTVESLGKITDEYIKGWVLFEMIPEIRYRYCMMIDKLGAKWLDVLLEFSQLSVEKRTEWLNRFMQNWSYVNSSGDVSEGQWESQYYHNTNTNQPHQQFLHQFPQLPHQLPQLQQLQLNNTPPSSSRYSPPYYNEYEEDFSYLEDQRYYKSYKNNSPSKYSVVDNDNKDSNNDSEDDTNGDEPEDAEEHNHFDYGDADDDLGPVRESKPNYQPLGESPVGNQGLLSHSQRSKRGRSHDSMEETKERAIEDEKDAHKRMRWEFVKNMQLMGSIRFELCKKCGMKEDCLRIAQQMDDREKIVESRLMAGDAGDDALNEAMNSLLHL